MLRGRDILVFASAPWQTAGPVNCHHVARRLAARNRVLYVESSGLRGPNLLHRSDLLKLGRRVRSWLSCVLTGPTPAAPNLFVLSPIALPLRRWSRAEELNAALVGRSCVAAARRLLFSRPILWAFLPSAVSLLGRLDECLTVYHCVDDLAGNPGVNAARIEQDQTRLARNADLCLATSRPLAAKLSAMGTRVACVSNVADTGRFAKAPARKPAELAALPKPIVGYVGNVASYKIDVELLVAAGRTRPEWSFALVGPIGSGDPGTRLRELRSLSNVHLLGPRPYKDIPDYIHGFDVCLIPFRRSRVTDSSLPLKTFEYLAAGKPVVATPLPALRAEPLDEVLDYAETAEQFVRAIESCLAEDGEERPAARRETAALYSWDRRFPEIEALVCEALAHKEQEETHGGNSQSALEAQ